MTDTTQAADIAAETAPTAPVEVPAVAQEDDLDTLLQQFETATKPTATPTPAPAQPDRVAQLERDLAEIKFEKAFEPVRSRIRGDVPADVLSDKELTKLIDGWAEEDPKLQQAWLNRSTNAKAWSSVEKALSARLAKKFQPRVDAQATEDVAAVAAAVRGASKQAPEERPPNLAGMSNGEYRRHVKDKFGYDPGV